MKDATTAEELADPYFSIKISDYREEDMVCDVCLEHEVEDENEMVICELCNAAVH